MVRISNGRSKRAERKYVEKQRAILRAAAEAFRELGFQRTGMRDVASRAGLSAANLYYYFDSKDELLYFCQDHALDLLVAAVEDARGSDAPAPARLRAVIEAQIYCMLDELDGAAAHVEVDALPKELREKIVKKRDRYERAVRGIVSEGVKAGELVAKDPTLVTRAILGALNGTTRWYRPGGSLSSRKVAAEYANYLVRGLLP